MSNISKSTKAAYSEDMDDPSSRSPRSTSPEAQGHRKGSVVFSED
jgi:hypothetical protein